MKKRCPKTAIFPTGRYDYNKMLSKSCLWDDCSQLWKHLPLPLSVVALKPFHEGNEHSSHFTDGEVEVQMNSSFPKVTPVDKRLGALALKLHTCHHQT